MKALPAIALTAGEPAGIGPELCLAIAARPWAARLVAIAPLEHLRDIAARLGLHVTLRAVSEPGPHRAGELQVIDVPLPAPCHPGRPDTRNADAVLGMLRRAARGCLAGEFDGMVTAPVNKAVINEAGRPFFRAYRVSRRAVGRHAGDAARCRYAAGRAGHDAPAAGEGPGRDHAGTHRDRAADSCAGPARPLRHRRAAHPGRRGSTPMPARTATSGTRKSG
jgi:hypothetical protein